MRIVLTIVRSARCLGAQFPAPCGAANNLQSNIPNIQTMSNPNIFVTNVKFRGWYDAPFPFGKTEFTLTIETHDETDGSFRKGPALTLDIHSANNPNIMIHVCMYFYFTITWFCC